MERIRDFLYDISDLLISLLIIAAIFTVISWKLNESIPIDTLSAAQTTEEPAAPPESEPQDPNATPPDSETAQTPVPADTATDASDADKPIADQPGTQEPDTTPPAAPLEIGKEITVEIPGGSPGIAIGKILKDKGLITDVSAFIKKVDELALGPKLRSGSFKLKTGMSLEAIIKTLANVNK